MSRDTLRNYNNRALRRPVEKPKSERQRQLEFAIEELDFRREMLAEMAPATDSYEYMMWKVRALERSIAELRKPYFEVSPLL